MRLLHGQRGDLQRPCEGDALAALVTREDDVDLGLGAVLIADGFGPGANGPLVMRFSVDGGAVFLTGATDYSVAAADIRGSGIAAVNAATTYAELSPSTAANLHGTVEFETINNKAFRFDVSSPSPPSPFRRSGTGYASFGSGINAVMLGIAGANIGAGRFRLLGGY